TAPCTSTRPPTAGTARRTSRCSTSSERPIWRRSSADTNRCIRFGTGGASGSRCINCTRSPCTPSATGLPTAACSSTRPAPPARWPEGSIRSLDRRTLARRLDDVHGGLDLLEPRERLGRALVEEATGVDRPLRAHGRAGGIDQEDLGLRLHHGDARQIRLRRIGRAIEGLEQGLQVAGE